MQSTLSAKYEKAPVRSTRVRLPGRTAREAPNFVAASYAALGDSANAKATLRFADLLENADFNWENWLKRSWQNPEDSEHILRLLEDIRK
jgi:hypothetical protein